MIFVTVGLQTIAGEVENVEQLYLDAQFARVVEYFEKKDYSALSLPGKLLFIESLARTSKGLQAEEKLKPLLVENPSDPSVLAAAGAVYFSLGELNKSQGYIDRALEIEPGFDKAILARVMLLLFQQNFIGAKQAYEILADRDRGWPGSEILFLTGIDVLRAGRNPVEIRNLYKSHAQTVKKSNTKYYQNLESDSRMYKHPGQNILFQVETGSDRVVIPFAAGKKSPRVNTILITIKGKTFKVLLDTGNATGLLIHNRELNELLKPKTGGRTITGIGTESGMLDGYSQYYKSVDFNAFKLLYVNGIYLPKPNPDFPDVNFNPACIRNRVVTIDFVKNEIVLQTKEQFEKNLSSYPQGWYTRLPWYGNKFPYVPVTVMKKKGLAVIETGAEDIALKLDFVKGLQMELIPKVKYLANGQVFKYHHTAVLLSIGRFFFQREEVEVWPLDRFFDPITGLSPDVVIGPNALEGEFVVSFDPFDKQVIFSTPK